MMRASRMLNVVLFLTVPLSGSCRTIQDTDDSDALSVAPSTWYDVYGEAEECAPVADACPEFSEEKEFADRCVAAGFKAMTCGCKIMCSGKTEFVKPKPLPAAESGSSAGDAVGCPAADLQWIEGAQKSVAPGSTSSFCLTAHVCQGRHSGCKAEDLKVSGRLRDLARGGCERAVVAQFCRDGYADSLECPEADIAILSTGLDRLHDGAPSLRRCLKSFICNDNASTCSSADLATAKKYRSAINRDGCEYWLMNWCSLGGR